MIVGKNFIFSDIPINVIKCDIPSADGLLCITADMGANVWVRLTYDNIKDFDSDYLLLSKNIQKDALRRRFSLVFVD